MKPTIDLYYGSPIELDSEKLFLGNLIADLTAQGYSALILANFFPLRNPHQIDFLVVAAQCACHVELKKLTAPVIGGINGRWSLCMPNNSLLPLNVKNPYRQALDGKLAISDQMHDFAATDPSIPRPETGGKFYKHFESVICVFPELLPGSSVYQDHKVRIRSYGDLLTLLARPQTKPMWSRDHWIAFAMHLGLIRAEDAEDRTSPENRTSQQACAKYGERFQDFYGRDLPALVPTPIEEEREVASSDAFLNALLSGGHMQLVGPSGCGKSLLAKHMALAAIRGGRLPILASAKDYEGKLSSLLDRSVAHLYPDTAIQFLNAAARCGNPVALILDGSNECPAKRKKELFKDLQAFYLRWPVPILIAGQEAVRVPEPLSGRTLRFAPLNSEQKLGVLRSYAGDRLPADAGPLCEAFQTPYELSLAAESLAGPGAPTSRAALFDAYTWRRCEQTANAPLARSILCAIADRMHRRLMSSLPASEVLRLAASTLGRDGGRMLHLTKVFDCGLLDMRQGRCAFRHELIERFFQAEALVRECGSGVGLAKALTLPRNRALTEFVIGVETDPEVIRRCLEAVADSTQLSDCLRGRYGVVARDVAAEDCSKMLQAAERALDEVDVQLTGPDEWKTLVLTGGPLWSAYERALMQAIGNLIPEGSFLDEAFRLIGRTDERCRSALAERSGGTGILGWCDAMHLFKEIYVVTFGDGGTCLPASTVYHATCFHFRLSGVPAIRHGLLRLAISLESQTPGQLVLLCELLRNVTPDLQPIVPGLLSACWRTGIYHLRLRV